MPRQRGAMAPVSCSRTREREREAPGEAMKKVKTGEKRREDVSPVALGHRNQLKEERVYMRVYTS